MWAAKGYSLNATPITPFKHGIVFKEPYLWLNNTPKGMRFSYFVELTQPDRKEIESNKIEILKRIA